MLCVSCGGKGFYLLIDGIPGTKINPIGNIVPCDCEDGFKYSKGLVEDHGST